MKPTQPRGYQPRRNPFIPRSALEAELERIAADIGVDPHDYETLALEWAAKEVSLRIEVAAETAEQPDKRKRPNAGRKRDTWPYQRRVALLVLAYCNHPPRRGWTPQRWLQYHQTEGHNIPGSEGDAFQGFSITTLMDNLKRFRTWARSPAGNAWIHHNMPWAAELLGHHIDKPYLPAKTEK
jgi:hypothetical protein